MRILCIADIHGFREGLVELKRFALSRGVEKVLILGDFPSHGAFRDLKSSLADVRFALDALSDLDVLAIPGNCDAPEILDVFDEYSVNLHDKIIRLGGVSIAGFGGSAPTPFDTPFEFGEDVLYERLESLLSGVTSERLILAVHNPPADTLCDMRSNGDHVGSRAVRKIAERYQPDLLLCSHIHESGGAVDLIGETKVANIGPLADRRIGILDISDDIHMGLGRF